jgi:CRISPR type III-A-associated RAMP protein Csm5
MTWIKCKLKAITPIHISCNVTYPAFSYSINNNKVEIYDIIETIASSKVDLEEFSSIIENNKDNNKIKLYAKDLFEQLNIQPEKAIKISEVENKGLKEGKHIEIHEFIHYKKDGKIFRYIPGSSIKGAIRTALLWWAWKNKDICNFINQNSINLIEKVIFGDNPKEDALKCILVSDSELIDERNFAVYVMKRRKIPRASICFDKGKETTFCIKLNTKDKKFEKLKNLLEVNTNKEEEIVEKIFEICNEFYNYSNNDKYILNIGFGGGYNYKTIKKLLINCWKEKTLQEIEKIYGIWFACPKKYLKNIIKYNNFPTTEWRINGEKPGFVKIFFA